MRPCQVLALALVAILAACQKPNLEPTEGGYRGAGTRADTVAIDSAAQAR